MASMSNHSIFVTCLSTTHKLLNKHVPLRTHFENSYREHLCNFNFEQYIALNCVIPLPKMVDALKNACIDTRNFISEELERGLDSNLHDSYLSIFHQIWTPFSSATLAQLAKSSNANTKATKSKVTTPAAEEPILPKLSKQQAESTCDELWQLASTATEPLYPKLCAKKNCSACCELLFDLPLSKCSVDCSHKKLTAGVFPHLSRKFQEKLKPHHGLTPVKVKQQFRPNTYQNPMYEAEPPQFNNKTETELAQGVERMEIYSTTTSASTSTQSINVSGKQQKLRGNGTPGSSEESWAKIVEREQSGGPSDPCSTQRSMPRKRTSRSVDSEDEIRACTPQKQHVRRSPRTATQNKQ